MTHVIVRARFQAAPGAPLPEAARTIECSCGETVPAPGWDLHRGMARTMTSRTAANRLRRP